MEKETGLKMILKRTSKIILLLLGLLSFLLPGGTRSQHITNTLGTSGQFKIKDASATYFTLTQSNGYIELTKSLKLQETSDMHTGVIYKGNIAFIHNYMSSSNLGNNLFIGLSSGNFTLGGGSHTNGSLNLGLGSNTLNSLTSGSWNIAIGHACMPVTTSGVHNTAIGDFSMNSNTTGSYNVSLGGESLFSNVSSTGNVALGYYAMHENITGLGNVSVGSSALEQNTSGSDNTAIGKNTLLSNITGFRNTALGNSALANNLGAYNTAIGYDAGTNITTGSNLTLLGQNSEPSSGTTMNQVTLGNNSVTSLRCNVQTITSLSDARDKKNINTLSLGLDFLMHLKPRQFNWDRREWYDNNTSDGSLMENDPTAGFIAQELDSVQNEFNAPWLKLVLKDNPEKWEATYGNLLPVVVKAVQELKAENVRLAQENSALAEEIKRLRSIEERVAAIESMFNRNEESKEINNAGK